MRRALTVAQVALAVLLLVGSVLYVRSYLALLRLDKGFDSTGVVAVSLIIPPQLFGRAAERQVLTQTILDRLRARPGVIAAFEGSPPPHTGNSPSTIEQLKWTTGRPRTRTWRFRGCRCKRITSRPFGFRSSRAGCSRRANRRRA